MKIPKKKPTKVQSKLLALAVLMIAFAGSLLFAMRSEVEQKQWPYAALPFAQEITLSQAKNLLTEDANGRRAAVVGYTLLIEAAPGAGNNPERLAGAFDNYIKTLAAEHDAKQLEQAEKAEDAADGEEQVPYEVLEPKIVLDVVSTTFPSITSGFVDRLVESTDFDLGVYADKAPEGFTADDILNVLFMLMLLGFFGFIIFTMVGKSNFGTSKSFTIIKPEDLTTGLDDVAGIGLVKSDIEEVINLLKSPGDAAHLGARMPRGALLEGPPGTGKTLVAKAVAKEAGVTFISVDASSLSALYVGLGAIKARAIFRRARKEAPCIVFIDEIDAMGRKRSSSGNPGSDEKENTLNAILTELDGFDDRSGIFIIGATNRAEILDPALLRPGRIDRRITMMLPDIAGREEILEVHCKDKPLADEVDLKAISASTYGLSGAQLANLVNEAALSAYRAGREEISQDDFRIGRDRAILPRSSSQINLVQEDRHLTAVHEAGHALMAAVAKHADPIEKVTILPQGSALGFVMQAPDRDHIFHSKAYLKDRIRVAVAGREAEKAVFGEDMVTTGAASDIKQATAVARAMVTQYGMSSAGFVEIDARDPVLCDGQGQLLKLVASLIEEEQIYVGNLFIEKRHILDEITRVLEQKETITGADVMNIVDLTQ